MSAEFRSFQTLKSTGRILRLREKDFCFLCPFLFKGRFLSGEETRDFDTGRNFPFWGITFRDAGDMKFPPETGIQQENRKNLYTVLGLDGAGAGYPLRVKLVHSKKVFYCFQKKGTFPENLGEGDGIICSPDSGIPFVTCADCMPVYVYDVVNSNRAVFHSGWRGTGIVSTGIALMKEKTTPENLAVVIGPHIRDCCYRVDKNRAEYFAGNFTPSAVKFRDGNYYLSLLEANLFLLAQSGIPEENILVFDECTSCNPLWGSFRREGPENFTRMAAFIL